MADKKISELNSSSAEANDEIPIVRTNSNFKVSASSIAALTTPAGSADGQLQFKSSTAFGASGNLSFSTTDNTLSIGTPGSFSGKLSLARDSIPNKIVLQAAPNGPNQNIILPEAFPAANDVLQVSAVNSPDITTKWASVVQDNLSASTTIAPSATAVNTALSSKLDSSFFNGYKYRGRGTIANRNSLPTPENGDLFITEGLGGTTGSGSFISYNFNRDIHWVYSSTRSRWEILNGYAAAYISEGGQTSISALNTEAWLPNCRVNIPAGLFPDAAAYNGVLIGVSLHHARNGGTSQNAFVVGLRVGNTATNIENDALLYQAEFAISGIRQGRHEFLIKRESSTLVSIIPYIAPSLPTLMGPYHPSGANIPWVSTTDPNPINRVVPNFGSSSFNISFTVKLTSGANSSEYIKVPRIRLWLET